MIGRASLGDRHGIARCEEQTGDAYTFVDQPTWIAPKIEHQGGHPFGDQPVNRLAQLAGGAVADPAELDVADAGAEHDALRSGGDMHDGAGQATNYRKGRAART